MAATRPCPYCEEATARRPTWPGVAPDSACAPYVTCGRCGLVFAEGLDSEELAALHRRQYRGEAEPARLARLDPERSRQRQYAPGFQRDARALLTSLAEGIAARPLRLLEVGCAAGGLLHAARGMGMEPVGVELSVEAARFGREAHGLDVHVGELAGQGFGEGTFHIAVLYDLIEHVHDPARLLDECARVLAPGGRLAVHTLNLSSWTARLAGERFYLADAGAGHATLFTTATLRRFVERTGLTVERLETRGFRLVQRDADRERRLRGWRRPLVRLPENLLHELAKPFRRGHFQLLVAAKYGTAFSSAESR